MEEDRLLRFKESLRRAMEDRAREGDGVVAIEGYARRVLAQEAELGTSQWQKMTLDWVPRVAREAVTERAEAHSDMPFSF